MQIADGLSSWRAFRSAWENRYFNHVSPECRKAWEKYKLERRNGPKKSRQKKVPHQQLITSTYPLISLPGLPLEIQQHITSYLDIQSVLRLRKTSKIGIEMVEPRRQEWSLKSPTQKEVNAIITELGPNGTYWIIDTNVSNSVLHMQEHQPTEIYTFFIQRVEDGYYATIGMIDTIKVDTNIFTKHVTLLINPYERETWYRLLSKRLGYTYTFEDYRFIVKEYMRSIINELTALFRGTYTLEQVTEKPELLQIAEYGLEKYKQATILALFVNWITQGKNIKNCTFVMIQPDIASIRHSVYGSCCSLNRLLEW